MALAPTLAPTLALLVFALVAVGLLFVSPIADSDVFWHMAYARQMIERRSLVLDHTAFSWTPTSNAMVYCAWIAEFALLGLWKAFGLGGLFALRYVAAVAIAALLWRFARSVGVALTPFLVFVVLLVVLLSGGVLTAKPEAFSVVFTHGVLYTWFRLRHADRRGAPVLRYAVALPALMLVWVNTHGGFILAAPIFVAMLAGELLNRRVSPAIALTPRAWRLLSLACLACALTVVATPYGLEYPRQLVADYLLHGGTRPDVAWNNAHRSPFSPAGREAHLVQALALMLCALGVLAWQHRRQWRTRFDMVSLLLVLGTVPLYVAYMRSMYVLVAVFGYVAVWLAVPASAGTSAEAAADGSAHVRSPANDERRHTTAVTWAMQGAYALLVLVVGAVSMTDSVRRPNDRIGWLGFGISALNPVEETAYLEHAGFGGNIYNTFETGGYLLWKRTPAVKVMTDARSFPYLSWFDDHFKLVSGDSFAEFLRKFPGADVAVVDYAKGPLLRNFVRSGQWRAVFAGPCAVVFVREGSAAAQLLHAAPSDSLGHLHNAEGALAIFDFARFAGDFGTAWTVLDQLQTTLFKQLRTPDLLHQAAAASDYRRALQAARDGRYGAAHDLMNGALNAKVISAREDTTLRVLRSLAVGASAVGASGVGGSTRASLEQRLVSLLGPPVASSPH